MTYSGQQRSTSTETAYPARANVGRVEMACTVPHTNRHSIRAMGTNSGSAKENCQFRLSGYECVQISILFSGMKKFDRENQTKKPIINIESEIHHSVPKEFRKVPLAIMTLMVKSPALKGSRKMAVLLNPIPIAVSARSQ